MNFMINQIGMVIPIKGIIKNDSNNDNIYQQNKDFKIMNSFDYLSFPRNFSNKEENLTKKALQRNNRPEKNLSLEKGQKHTSSMAEVKKIYGGNSNNKKNYTINNKTSYSSKNSVSKKSFKETPRRQVSNHSDSTEEYYYDSDLMIFHKNPNDFNVVNSNTCEKLNKAPNANTPKKKNFSMKINKYQHNEDDTFSNKDIEINNQNFIEDLPEIDLKSDEDNLYGEERRINFLDKIRSKIK